MQERADDTRDIDAAQRHRKRKRQSKSPNRNRGVQLRLGPPVLKRVEDWRRRQTEIPPRSEAVRALLELGLDAERNVRVSRDSCGEGERAS
jgi:hypothetical protein